MKNAYLVPRSHFPERTEANSLLNLIESSHKVTKNVPVREEGKLVGALIVTEKPISTEDLVALGMSAPVSEAYADKIIAAR